MIKVNFDDSKLPKEGHTFLGERADSLGITVADLLGRILDAAVEGEHYVELMPSESEPAL